MGTRVKQFLEVHLGVSLMAPLVWVGRGVKGGAGPHLYGVLGKELGTECSNHLLAPAGFQLPTAQA